MRERRYSSATVCSHRPARREQQKLFRSVAFPNKEYQRADIDYEKLDISAERTSIRRSGFAKSTPTYHEECHADRVAVPKCKIGKKIENSAIDTLPPSQLLDAILAKIQQRHRDRLGASVQQQRSSSKLAHELSSCQKEYGFGVSFLKQQHEHSKSSTNNRSHSLSGRLLSNPPKNKGIGPTALKGVSDGVAAPGGTTTAGSIDPNSDHLAALESWDNEQLQCRKQKLLKMQKQLHLTSRFKGGKAYTASQWKGGSRLSTGVMSQVRGGGRRKKKGTSGGNCNNDRKVRARAEFRSAYSAKNKNDKDKTLDCTPLALQFLGGWRKDLHTVDTVLNTHK
jgi:hypothetical protein